jgi:hypothetical protein
VLLCDVNAKALDAAVRELGDRAIGRVTNVADIRFTGHRGCYILERCQKAIQSYRYLANWVRFLITYRRGSLPTPYPATSEGVQEVSGRD